MKKIFALISMLLCAVILQAQVITWDEFYPSRNQHTVLGGAAFLSDYKGNTDSKKDPLPPIVDNTNNPFFSFVLNQAGPSCQQFSSIGYAFSYELNLAKDTPFQDTLSLCPPLFSFNMLHDGNAWNGISMFPSLKIARDLGHPKASDFYLWSDSTTVEWMSGYDKWYSAMHNRLQNYYRIDISTAEGQQTLKRWLYNHDGASEYGGVALFNSNTPWNAIVIPEGLPEEGKHLVTAWSGIATHGMTLVGYNDSILFDYNNDGLFTTDIDINQDGKIDILDSEKGAFKLINSYGPEWGDNGCCYVMYKAMAERYPYGGVWNNEAIILDINENYSPAITMRYKIKTTSRDKIRFTAGISANPAIQQPQYLLDLPCFRYQGGDNTMQGFDEEGQEIFEGGFDLTPLLSFVENPDDVTFYLLVNSYDPDMVNDGEVIELEIIDYQSNISVSSEEVPLPIEHNKVNLYGISITPETDNPTIITPENIPSDNKTQVQLETENGTPPYIYKLKNRYLKEYSETAMPPTSGPVLHDPDETPVVLPFEFPFYGQHFDTVTVNRAGFIMFGEKYYPWPYCLVPSQAFNASRMIAASLNPWYDYLTADARIQVNVTEEKASFFWISDATYELHHFQIAAALELYPDGRINIYNGSGLLPEGAAVVSGISAGDDSRNNHADLQNHNAVTFIPEPFPDEITLSSDGLLEISGTQKNRIYSIPVMVDDNNHLTAEKTFIYSDGPAVTAHIHGVESSFPAAGSKGYIDIITFPDNEIQQAECTVTCESPYITNLSGDGTVSFSNTSSTLHEDHFSFDIDPFTPNNSEIFFEFTVDTMVLTARAIIHSYDIKVLNLEVNDNDDAVAIPGETFFLDVLLNNTGQSEAMGLTMKISSPESDITFFEDLFPVDQLKNNEHRYISVPAKIDEDTEKGTKVNLTIDICKDGTIIATEDFYIHCGTKDFAVINLSENTSSADTLFNDIQNLGYLTDMFDTIDNNIEAYKTTLLCFGDITESYTFPQEQMNLLNKYMSDGGNVYAEGQRFWFPSDWTSIHDRFRVEGERISAYNIENLILESDTIHFDYGQNILINKIEPLWPAYKILTTPENTCLSVFCDYQNKKTVASTILYGYILNGESQDRIRYLNEILDFLNAEEQEIKASILSTQDTVYPHEEYSVLMNSNRSPDIIVWDLDNATIAEDHNSWLTVYWDDPGDKNISCTLQYPDTTITVHCNNCVHVIDNTSVDEFESDIPFNIYPVPVKEVINITPLTMKPATFALAGMDGSIVCKGILSNNLNTINTESFAAGTYMLFITTTEKVYSQKIIILN